MNNFRFIIESLRSKLLWCAAMLFIYNGVAFSQPSTEQPSTEQPQSLVKPSERVLPANAPKVSGTVEPDSIGIGDRFTLSIEVEKDLMQEVYFPNYGEGGSEYYELIEDMPVDTLSREGRKLRLRKSYKMAAFQEGYHNMVAEVMYADKNIIDTLRGKDTLQLLVTTFIIDSTSHTIFDIKPQRDLPFKVGEISGYLTWAVIAIIILVLLILLARRILAHYGKNFTDLFKPAPPLPPHQIALRDLQRLKQEHLWQDGKHKLYYSTLTDILRAYIAGVWSVGALEMTSDEIIEAMRGVELPQKQAMDLGEILREADLVKFAKAVPEAEQNEEAYRAAWDFVEKTMPKEEEAEENE